MTRRTEILALVMLAALAAMPARAADTPGVTATEIKFGQNMPYSGPAADWGSFGIVENAVFRMINEQGGINGRKLVFLSHDDGYVPARTVDVVKKMVEEDGIAFTFNTLGTSHNIAIQQYLNDRGIPHLFPASGSDRWGHYKEFPWTVAWEPSYLTESMIWSSYMLKELAETKVGILYQNDDFGKDYIEGLKQGLGDKYAGMVVKEVPYEVTENSIDAQLQELRTAGVETLVVAATPKHTMLAIRYAHDSGWRPLVFLPNVSNSPVRVVEPAGPTKAVGAITAVYLKDPSDPAFKDDPGLGQWRQFMADYLPDKDLDDMHFVQGYGVAMTLVQVLRQCGNDPSRANILRQAENLRDLEVPVLLPGIKVNTSTTNHNAIRQMQLARWDGTRWVRFGEIIAVGPTS